MEPQCLIAIDSNGVLDLTKKLGNDGFTALVVGLTEGDLDLSKPIATLTYTDANGYELSNPDSGLNELKSVKLGTAVRNFTTAIDMTVTTSTGTYAVNGKTFYARTALILETTSNGAILTGGIVKLNADDEVATSSDTIKATKGSVTVEVDGSTVTIGKLEASGTFTVGETSYMMTAIGLTNGDRVKEIGDSITIADLSSDWQTIKQASGGALTIDARTANDSIVVDMSNPNRAIKYGTLTKTGNKEYKFKQDGNSDLTSVTLDGVRATIDKVCSGVTITSGDTTLTATATADFTADATGDNLKLSNVTAINLTAGTIQASKNIPITANRKSITATSGDMTVGIVDGKVIVGALNTGDTFTVGNTSYEMTAAGLYDAASKQIIIKGMSDDLTTFTVDDAVLGKLIPVNGSTLDLTNESGNAGAFTVDSDGNPLKKLAELLVSGGKMTLHQVAAGIKTVEISKNTNIDVDFTAAVNSPIGFVTVNDNSYDGTTNLVIDSDGETSTLYSGTINLDSSTPAAKATNDETALIVTNGSFTATADEGYFTELNGVDVKEKFTFGDKAYTMTSIGLINKDRVKSVNTSIALAELDSGWQTIKQAPSGVLTIDARTEKDSIVVDISNPNRAIKYGTLTKSGNEYTFTQTGSDELTTITLNGVKANLDKPCSGVTITAGNTTLTATATADFTVDVTASPLMLSNVEKISLSWGTIQAAQDVPVSAKAYKVTATGGAMTIGISDAGKVIVGALNNGDTFKVGETSYEMTAAGLYDAANKRIVTNGLSTDMTTFTIDDAAMGEVLSVDENGVLDLTRKLGNDGYAALVVGLTDGAADPTKPITVLIYIDNGGYELTYANSYAHELKSVKLGTAIRKFTTAIETTVTTATGVYSINDKSFIAQTALTLETTSNGAILTDGTVTLNKDDEVMTASGNIYADMGTITVSVSNGTVTIGALNTGDKFTVDHTTLEMTAAGLYDAANHLRITAGLSDDKRTFILGETADDGATDGDDIITNYDAAITIDALAGNDSISNYGDNVTIYGGDGADTITNIGNNVKIDGGADNDKLSGGNGIDTLIGGTGNDSLNGGSGNDKLSGGDGIDTLIGGTGNDSLNGGSGNDKLSGGDGTDTLIGGTGNDSLNGGSGNDKLSGGDGTDTLIGGAGDDLFIYNAGNDVITDYTAGEDKISLGAAIDKASVSGSDVVLIVGSNKLTVKNGKDKALSLIDSAGKELSTIVSDVKIETFNNNSASKVTLGSAIDIGDASTRTKAIRIVGNALDNSIVGGSGKDSLYGGDGDDTLAGGAGNDKLYGQNGDDSLYGGAGNDSLHGGKGEDTLWGSTGNDTLTGSTGNDLFIYSGGKDVITDYAAGDMISLGAAVSKASISGNNVILNFGSSSKTLTIKNAKYKELTFIDAAGNDYTKTYGKLVLDNAASANQIIDSDVEVVDATARTKSIRITGNDECNTILGGSGKNTIYGGENNDSLVGGKLADKLFGGYDDDTLIGGLGNDTFWGGGYDDDKKLMTDDGADVFIYNAGDGKDVIVGFDETDEIRLVGVRIDDITVNQKSATTAFIIDSKNSITFKQSATDTFNIDGTVYEVKSKRLCRVE